MSPASRADWVDAARTLAMFFIVWLHADAAPDWVGRPVGGAIALFYLLAGYFLPAEPGRALGRTLRLAVAWGLWSLLSLGLMAICAPDFEFSWQRSIGWGVAAYNTPLWFLKTLVVYQLVAVVLQWLRVLPRYKWLVVVIFALFSYTTAPAQYAAVRFDYFWIFLLGFCAKGVKLQVVQQYIRQNVVALSVAVALCLLQPLLLAQVAGWAELPWRHCNLPVGALGYMGLYLLAGVLLERFLPRVAGSLAFCGRWMLFIYAAHSFLLAPLYGGYNPDILWNLWVPVLVLPLLAWGGWGLSRAFPRCMAWLMARASR